MKIRAVACLAVLGSMFAAPASGQTITKMPSTSLAEGAAFASPEAERGKDNGAAYADRILGKSVDRKMVTGVFESEANKTFYDSYPADEFMYFVTGKVTFTDVAGKVTSVGPGEGIFLPKGWKGTWASTAYRKYYVYYVDPAPKP